MAPQTPYAAAFAAILLALAASGCALIDQNTFNPNAGAAPVIPSAPSAAAEAPGPPPLAIIGSADTSDYHAPLRRAVAAARKAKPEVVFNVVEMQPPDADATGDIGSKAAKIAGAIVADGVAPSRVRLAIRPDAAAPQGQVRVYVQ